MGYKLLDNVENFPSEIFNVILSKRSFLDINRLNIETWEDAHEYVKNYGFDMDNQAQRDQVFAILNEAKQFIQSYLLEDPQAKEPNLLIPPHIQCEDDIRNFLVMAAERDKSLTQRWACAVLRVAHTITHVENDLSKYFFQGIKKQIFSRFMDHLTVNINGEYILGRGKSRIKLKLFEMKSEKTRESLIMKLLHKKENVNADVFDRVGVRIVTKDKLDVLMVLKYFEENHLISFANIKPSRTRNNLINTERFLEGVEQLKKEDIKHWSQDEVREYLDKFLQFDSLEKESLTEKIIRENNPYSSTEYSSIQLTARQLISINDPFNIQLAYKFFFPFEIQILDHNSFVESRTGRASHDVYKRNQTTAIRRRVLGNVLSYHRRHLWKDKREGGNDE